jgi:hypothetical protein
MKRAFILFSLLLFVVLGFAQVPNMRTNLRYNAAQCRYEVYVRPATSASSFYMGGSQIVIAVPHNAITNYTTFRRNAFVISTVAPSGNTWSITAYADKDFNPSYNGLYSFDYYAVDHAGGPLGAVTANTEILLFTFKLGQNCIDGIRLWEGVGVANGGVGAIPNAFNDPKYPTQPYGGGGDFETNFSEALANVEAWVGNYNNTPTVLPKPTANITYQCDIPIVNYATLTAGVTGGAACTAMNFVWSGPGGWLIPPGNAAQGVAASPYGTYNVLVTDNNGCQSNASLTLNAQCQQAPLPVELLSFTVTKDNMVAVLDWATATEMNNNYFDVQHSVDGVTFSRIDRVYSKNGNSTSLQTYQTTHNEPAKGVNYYRLKQVDFDGTFEFSDIRSVVFGNTGGLTIYPNPTNQILNVKVPVGMDNNSVIEIVNGTGQVVRSITNADATSSVLSFNVSDLALGFYFIQIRTSTDQYREQFILTK